MKLATFFISSNRYISTKLLAVSESSIKIKNRIPWTLLVTILTSPVTCRQKLLHGNVTEQYLQNWNAL